MRLSARRLLYLVVILLTWFSFVIQGSHALFQDEAYLRDLSIASGTASLVISNSQNPSSTIYDAERPGFTYTLSPGGSEEKYLLLKNSSGSDIALDIDVSVTILGTVVPELLDSSIIEFTPVDETGISTGPTVTDSLGNYVEGHKPLGLKIAKGTVQRLKMNTGLLPSLTEQGMTISYDIIFTGTQSLGS